MDLPEDNSGAPIPIAVSFEGDSAESQLVSLIILAVCQ